MFSWRVRCMITGASRADIEQWMAHHLTGKYELFSDRDGIVTVDLESLDDRLRLREAFDLIKMVFA